MLKLPTHPSGLMGMLLMLPKPDGWQPTVITPSGRTVTFRGPSIAWRVSGYTSSTVTLRATRSKSTHEILFNDLIALLTTAAILIDDG
jgi:hypothetical protein